MFIYEKKLQYPVNIANPNPKLAAVIISQYGGPDGELGASLRYLSQRYSMPYAELKGLLTDIGTEELGHLGAKLRVDLSDFRDACVHPGETLLLLLYVELTLFVKFFPCAGQQLSIVCHVLLSCQMVSSTRFKRSRSTGASVPEGDELDGFGRRTSFSSMAALLCNPASCQRCRILLIYGHLKEPVL